MGSALPKAWSPSYTKNFSSLSGKRPLKHPKNVEELLCAGRHLYSINNIARCITYNSHTVQSITAFVCNFHNWRCVSKSFAKEFAHEMCTIKGSYFIKKKRRFLAADEEQLNSTVELVHCHMHIKWTGSEYHPTVQRYPEWLSSIV